MCEDGLNDPSPAKVVASPIYRGPDPLPKCLGGKGSHNGQFRRETTSTTDELPREGSVGENESTSSTVVANLYL